MQQFVRNLITIREKVEQEKKKPLKCPSCGRDEKLFFRNLMNTLECLCGVKFYGR